jgi:alpha-mannosidase
MNTADRTTIHLVGNAHIDPVWLWRYSSGVTEAIATCHTAAALLDRYPEFVFTRADSWVYEQIERFDPALFARIRDHVRGGRWDATGGWYLQPDCNFPTEEAFLAHMRIGKEYFRESFGLEVTTGMNVDSFGHTAFLPRFLRQSGFDSYVFMRPGVHERELPSELFRWSSPDGHEVLTWRIQQSYNADSAVALERNIEVSLAAAVPGLPHVLCYYGVGDHGGGPTAELIEWILDNKQRYPDVDLEFSSPTRFFDALRAYPEELEGLPRVTGELQYHAIGCYSVLGSFRRRLRQAEYSVIEADLLGDAPNTTGEAWKPILLNQFHDTAGGTCIKEAYHEAENQLGAASDRANGLIADSCYGRLVSLTPAHQQRMVLFNSTETAFRGPVSHEPWLEWKAFHGTLLDSAGTPTSYQLSQQSALMGEKRLLTWIAEIPAGGVAEYYLDPSPTIGAADSAGTQPAKGTHWTILPAEDDRGLFSFRSADHSTSAGRVKLIVLEDTSDTWSHGISSYEGRTRGSFEVHTCEEEGNGPVHSTTRIETAFERSSATIFVREFAKSPVMELEVRIAWHEQFSTAKLCFSLPKEMINRTDAVPGGTLSRPRDGREYPIGGWVQAATENGKSLAVVSPDCFACDFRDNDLRLTLLRSAPFAWHDPTELTPGYPYKFTDQGEHTFRFTVIMNADLDTLNACARFCYMPPRVFDWTRGMNSAD